jgi:hypothetical protein
MLCAAFRFQRTPTYNLHKELLSALIMIQTSVNIIQTCTCGYSHALARISYRRFSHFSAKKIRSGAIQEQLPAGAGMISHQSIEEAQPDFSSVFLLVTPRPPSGLPLRLAHIPNAELGVLLAQALELAVVARQVACARGAARVVRLEPPACTCAGAGALGLRDEG